jgi:glycosyltransferase involved in cell wall biosynthesis
MSELNTNSNEAVVLIAPLGEPGKRVRLAKTIRIIKDRFHRNINFWGWRRTPDETLGANLDGITETRALLTGGGFRSVLTRFYYLIWMLRVFLALLWHAPSRVYCLGLETALPAWVASRLRPRIKYVFDDADRLVMIWSLPRPVEKLIVTLEQRVSRDAVTHIIPTLERYDYRTTKLYEIANMPDKNQVEEAKRIKKSKGNDSLHIYVNGWLDSTRGLDLIDQVAEILERGNGNNIVFNVAVGRVTGELTKFLQRSNVNYLGSLTHIQSLAQYPANDVVVTFYDPAININRYALPNKWGDAIAMGTPIVLNEEIRTAKPLITCGAAFTVPFNDPEALALLLRNLCQDSDLLDTARIAITSISDSYKPFGEAINPVMEAFLEAN